MNVTFLNVMFLLQLQDISTSNDWNVGGFSVPEVLINILKNSEVPPEVIFNVELSREEQASGTYYIKIAAL